MVTSSSEVEEAASEEGTGHGESRRPSHETPVSRGHVEELGKTSHVAGGGSIGSGAEYLVGSYVVYGVHLLLVVGTLSGTNPGLARFRAPTIPTCYRERVRAVRELSSWN